MKLAVEFTEGQTIHVMEADETLENMAVDKVEVMMKFRQTIYDGVVST